MQNAAPFKFLPPIVKTVVRDALLLPVNDIKSSLASLYPRDFEVYFVALELTTADGDTIDYFTFPINPSSIEKSETETTTVQHSLSGTTVFNKDGYTPGDISISGNFARSFSFVLNDNTEINAKGFEYSIENGRYNANSVNTNTDMSFDAPILSSQVKTGFGCIKILQSIIDKAKAHDEKGRTFRLYFYNPALGEAYLVVPTKTPLKFSQNDSNLNMVWKYDLNLTIIADLADISFSDGDTRSLSKSISKAQNQKKINNVASSLSHYINDAKETISNITSKTVNYANNR